MAETCSWSSCRTKSQTLDKTGLVSVHLLIFEALVAVADRWLNRRTRSPGRQSQSVVWVCGKRLSESAFPICLPGL